MRCRCGSRRCASRVVGGTPTKKEGRYMIDDY
nr:MAG TPA: retinoblastoma-binding protein-like protein [Caudoviricetes sp.]